MVDRRCVECPPLSVEKFDAPCGQAWGFGLAGRLLVGEDPAAILRTRLGSAIASISTILPPATVKPITAKGRPATVTTTPAAPFTSAGRSCAVGLENMSACLATAAAPRATAEAAGRRRPPATPSP